MDRKARRKYIEQVVNDRKIETQEELLKLLADAGFETTQATISRDIHALNIVKANDGNGHTHYVQLHVTPEHNFERLYQGIHDNVRTIETVQFMNVIKTALNSSYATILAGMFDELDIPEVVGTLAGNDTLIIISKNSDDAKMVYDLIIQHMHS
ncbi:arginine repressor [Limosilactobacillus sp. RRLNB_1_1]|uniref:Arginine repressor n=1 Tax=Limosilactobacillus albertensis TaxID=2759752 RepID=A0A7W3TPX9_9LACO|nr:arginine repressor [Limosilactobacillus albertensis]MBB1068737.1 arginine repressor [Limosilactobacillus albertensis]MCD7118318.1 arginine repressor [Limosilactobacillus albertensis]MCD7127526.1 arginine repressor [Limosilactobacillus albertensis]